MTIQQASAIPFRRRGDEFDLCLVTSLSTGEWQFPKGIVDPGETVRETALKEAEEEAGVTGQIVGNVVGEYEYEKWASTLHVTVHLLEVANVEDDWMESDRRERMWVTVEELAETPLKRPPREIVNAGVDQVRELIANSTSPAD